LLDQYPESAPRRRKARQQSLLHDSAAGPVVRWRAPEGMRVQDPDDVLFKAAATHRYVHQKPALILQFRALRYS
jgi:hypothetical protein